MDASNWISLAFGIVSLGGLAVGYGALKQKVEGLKEADKTAEALQTANNAKMEARITTCEAGHANTAQEMNALRVDVAVLTERSGTTVATLERIERHVSENRQPTPPRSRATGK